MPADSAFVKEHYFLVFTYDVGLVLNPSYKKLSQIGKEARSLQCQTHIIGANSYANLRVDYEAEHGKPMGLIEAWERSHVRKDGRFVEGTVTQDFLVDAKAKVETFKLSAPSISCVDQKILRTKHFMMFLMEEKFPNDLRVLDLGSKRVMFMGFMVDLNSNLSPYNKKKEDLEKRNEELF
ncbi:Aspartyl/glutamyl-tRNA(Asn/Gln) amidotransferase subunit B [Bienertia sinuspersici]